MTSAIIIIIILRLFFWRMFPEMGTDLNSEIMFAALALTTLSVHIVFTRCDKQLRRPLIIMIIAMGISVFYSTSHSKSGIFMLSFPLYAIICASIRPKHLDNVLPVMFIGALVIAGKAIQEAFFIHRAQSYIGWPTATASVLLMAIPYALLMADKYRMSIYIVFPVILIAGMLATRSVMPLISLMIVLSMIVKDKRILAGMWICSICAALLLRQDLLLSIKVRLGYIDETFKMIQQHPFLGSGVATTYIDVTSKTAYAHNAYLQVWAETGIMGFSALCLLIHRILTMRPGPSTAERGIYFGLLAFMIDNIANFTLLRYTTSIYFWILLGCYLAMRGKK